MSRLQSIFHFYYSLIVTNKKWFLPIILVFLAGLLGGLAITLSNADEAQKILSGYANSIDTSLENGLALTTYLFGRNSEIVLITSFLGIFLGLIPLGITFINGTLLGIVAGITLSQGSLNIGQLLALLVPHGVFEYAASLLGLTFGLKLGWGWLKRSSKGNRFQVFTSDFRELVLVVPLVIFLLALAALIEGNLTSLIACGLTGACR